MPDVLPENHRAAGPGVGRSEIHPDGHESRRTVGSERPWRRFKPGSRREKLVVGGIADFGAGLDRGGTGACLWGWKAFRPLHWKSGDVGGVSVTGAFGQTNGVMTITGNGADIWNRADAFHYVYLAMKGDVALTVRVMDIQNTDPWAKAGLMIRQSLAPDSAYAMVLVTSGQGVAFQQRAAAGRQAVTETVVPGLHAPYWLRLVREGSAFMVAASADGIVWMPTNAVSIAMNDPVYAGLAVTSHRSGVLCRATFDHLTVTGSTATISATHDTSPVPSMTTKNDANRQLNLAAAARSYFPAAESDAKID